MPEAEKVLTELLELSKTNYVPEFHMVCFYGSLRKKEEAIELLEKGISGHANGYSIMKVVPLADDLRSYPEFLEIQQRLKLD